MIQLIYQLIALRKYFRVNDFTQFITRMPQLVL